MEAVAATEMGEHDRKNSTFTWLNLEHHGKPIYSI